jgi:plasmid stability protein
MKGASAIAPLGIRLPEELKIKIQESAAANGRSVNSEVVSLLEAALREQSGEVQGKNSQVIDGLNETINQLVESIKLQAESIQLYKEQVMLIKAFVKKQTGYDVQAFLDANVDYEAFGVPSTGTNKKPT